MKKTVLVVAAHPDDEILGCGGAVARLIQEGAVGYSLILGEGKTSRDEQRNVSKRSVEMENLYSEAHKANAVIGVKEIFLYDFPDNRFDTAALLDIVKVVEEVKQKVKPDIIFTHYQSDLNIDHRVTYNAVITATRPMPGETVKEIYSFENSSSTEWNFPLSFSPNVFFDISKTIELKKKALECYCSELCDFPHPRSIKGVELQAANWGMKMGVSFAEAFRCIRSVR